MAHRLVQEAEADLDDIWLYIAKESGSIDVADRVVDSLTERFGLLARYPYIGRSRDEDLREVFPLARISSSIASRMKT